MVDATSTNLASGIKSILSVKLNEFVADSVLRVNCKRLGVEPENLNEGNIAAFIEKIKVSLLLFLTKEEIDEIIQKIKEIKQ